jgi:FkbM family methyltransferase
MTLNSADDFPLNLLFAGTDHPTLRAILRRYVRADSYCIDVGANLGYYTLWMAAHAPQGRVLSIEANPHLAARLQQEIALNHFSHITLKQQAASQTTGWTDFYLSQDDGKSSLLPYHVDQVRQVVRVEQVRLDDLVQAQGWQRVDVIKVDIEGHDAAALLGAAHSITTFQPLIVFEFWRDTPLEIVQPLADLLRGYRLECLTLQGQRRPFAWHQTPLNLNHIDVIGFPPTRE